MRGVVSGIAIAPIASAAAAQAAPKPKAADGPAIASSAPAMAKDAAPALPTPAACQLTARDCASPSSRSAIAFSPGM